MKNILLPFAFLVAIHAMATPAPNFTITTSDNQALQLYQNFIDQGKLVVLEAFFINCPPCNTHAPLVQNLYTQMLAAYPGKVEFILLSTMSGDKNTNVAQYKSSKGLTMPAAGSDGGSVTALQPYTSNQFGLFLGTPTFIVIAPNTGEVHFDIRGNSASQTMTLLSEKIAELLPAAPPPPIFCNLRNAFDVGLQDVQLHAYNGLYDTTFLAVGNYTLSGVDQFGSTPYTVVPSKADNPQSGLTTYDLVLISKHILGIEALLCDWQRVAADVNCSGSITTFDIVTARKLILGIINDLPCGSYRFVPDSSSAMDGDCAAFTGIKLGDVTAGPCVQFSPNAEDRSPLDLNVSDRMINAGETIQLPVYSTETISVLGLQAAFNFDPKKLIFKSISSNQLLGFDENSYNLEGQSSGYLPISWIHPEGQLVQENSPLLMLELVAQEAGPLSALLGMNVNGTIRPELYDAEGNIYPIHLNWSTLSGDLSQASIQLYPNPSAGDFTIEVFRSKDERCLIELTNSQGKRIYQQIVTATRGQNLWQIQLDAPVPGLCCLRINGVQAGKVLLH